MSIFSRQASCYCAFCRTPRRVYRKKNVGFLDIIGSALAAAAAMLILWQKWDPRFFIIWVVFLAISETFIQFRWRLSVVCRQCGFDPVLYQKDHFEAARRVKSHLELRNQDPKSILLPPLNLPKVPAEKAKLAESAAQALAAGKRKGGLISRQI